MKVLDGLPRLAVGSHPDPTDPRKCAMNWVSLANGDMRITDHPDCAHPLLTRVVIELNDSLCTHREGDWLCGDCSSKVLSLAVRTMGTNAPATEERFKTVDVPLAAWSARKVLHLTRDQDRQACLDAIEAAEGWCAGTVSANAANAANAAAAYAAYAAYAAAYAAYAAYAANYAAYAANAAAAAYANAANYAGSRFQFVSDLIDEYDRLTGRRWHEPAADLRCVVNPELVNAK